MSGERPPYGYISTLHSTAFLWRMGLRAVRGATQVVQAMNSAGLRQGFAHLSVSVLALLVVACDPGAPTESGSLADRPLLVPQSQAGAPLPILTDWQSVMFARGAVLFDSVYTPATGLGPLSNGSSCVECHNSPVPGGSGAQIGVRATAFRGGVCDDLSAEGGPVIQQHVTPALHDALGIDSRPVPPEATAIGLRTTPAVWGSGLLDAVPDSEILAHADPDDRDGDGVLGRPNWTPQGRLGRFGRKAQIPTLWDFVGQAFIMEMGITNELFMAERTVDGKPLPPGVDPVADTEITHVDLNDADAYIRWMVPPAPVGPVLVQTQGRAIFSRIGCATCHVPELHTQRNPIDAVSYKVVPAFTDLLLHDMGPDLADICLGQALPQDFRTEPLWGLRFRSQFLHDGRAKTIAAAIVLHAGEATGARARYLALSDAERALLLRFLGNL